MLACTSGAPPVAAPAGPDLTAFVFTQAPAKYRTVSVRNNVTDALGRTTTLNSRLEFTTRVTLSGSKGERVFTILVDSVLNVEGQMFLAGSRNDVAGATLRGRVNSRGEMADMELDPIRLAEDPILGQISAAYRQYFPRLPTGRLVPGTEWSDTTTITRDQNGAEIVLEAVTAFHAGFWSDTTSGAELELDWIRSYTVSGSGEQMGQAFTVAGTGQSSGQHRFRADGFYLGSTMRDSSSSDIDVTSLGLTVPLTQTGIDSVVIIP